MTSAKKKGGLGAESYFENIPTLEPAKEIEPQPEEEVAEAPTEEEDAISPEVLLEAEMPVTTPDGHEEAPESLAEGSEIEPEPQDSDEPTEPSPRQKIRRTYALYEETQIALEEMKLAARKQGTKMTLGDLLEEAVQLLMEEKGMATQEIISH